MDRTVAAALIALGVVLILAVAADAGEIRGRASWYHEGRMTASGERLRPDGLTAAMRKPMAFGARLRVTNLRNGRAVTVRVNDRGPGRRTGCIIDLSRGAARVLGMLGAGHAPVRIERL